MVSLTILWCLQLVMNECFFLWPDANTELRTPMREDTMVAAPYKYNHEDTCQHSEVMSAHYINM